MRTQTKLTTSSGCSLRLARSLESEEERCKWEAATTSAALSAAFLSLGYVKCSPAARHGMFRHHLLVAFHIVQAVSSTSATARAAFLSLGYVTLSPAVQDCIMMLVVVGVACCDTR